MDQSATQDETIVIKAPKCNDKQLIIPSGSSLTDPKIAASSFGKIVTEATITVDLFGGAD
jgi:hypothetical protein